MLLGGTGSAHDKAAMRTDWVKPLTLLAERYASLSRIAFASGLTDPDASEADLMRANVAFPLRVIEATAGDLRFRYLTIGSALEGFAALATNNRYLASKAALGTRLCRLAGDLALDGRITHLRLHTLYGAAPALHSFLGQIYESLRMRRPFRMSEGRQLREYAHIADVARSICALFSDASDGTLQCAISARASRSCCASSPSRSSGPSLARSCCSSARCRPRAARTWSAISRAHPRSLASRVLPFRASSMALAATWFDGFPKGLGRRSAPRGLDAPYAILGAGRQPTERAFDPFDESVTVG